MDGFQIDQIQAEYIAEIKLRNLNREYIINRIQEIESLRSEIDELRDKIGDDIKIRSHIAAELKEIKKKFGKPRMTQLLDPNDIVIEDVVEDEESYPVRVIFTREGISRRFCRSQDSSK